MMRLRTLPLVLLLALGVGPARGATSGPAPPGISRLAFRHVGGSVRPELVLAQRTIDREWGPSDDSVYVEVDVPGWKSEPLATMFSAVLPGAGQLYAGQRSGWVFAALEAAGWGGWWWYRHDARRLQREAAGLAGVPDDPASGWSFARWSAATDNDPAEIVALYGADRDAFYHTIASDSRYLSGWENGDARARFGSLRIRSQARLTRSRAFATGLWLNHLVAPVAALRAARLANLPLRGDVDLLFRAGVQRGAAAVTVALERKL